MKKTDAIEVLRGLRTEIHDYERPMGLVPRQVENERIEALDKAIRKLAGKKGRAESKSIQSP